MTVAINFDPDHDACLVIGERTADGRLVIRDFVDDVTEIVRWGDGAIVRTKTRDPVMVRRDGQCHVLVTEGS